MTAPELTAPYRILVAEPIADSGVRMLRERFDVDVGVGWSAEELAERIGGYHGIVIRSATKLTADLIARGDKLKVIGRAGVGVDNVDVQAATKRGIIVANAPQSNIITAAEHTMGMLLALATSTLSTPTPARPMTFSRLARSMSAASIVVAERMRIAS